MLRHPRGARGAGCGLQIRISARRTSGAEAATLVATHATLVAAHASHATLWHGPARW